MAVVVEWIKAGLLEVQDGESGVPDLGIGMLEQVGQVLGALRFQRPAQELRLPPPHQLRDGLRQQPRLIHAASSAPRPLPGPGFSGPG